MDSESKAKFEPQWLNKQDKLPLQKMYKYTKEELLALHRPSPLLEVFGLHVGVASQESLPPILSLPLEQQTIDAELQLAKYAKAGKFTSQRGRGGPRGRGMSTRGRGDGQRDRNFRQPRTPEDLWDSPGIDPFFDKFGAKTEETTQWMYKDPQGEIQGPFTSAEMHEWYEAGYFTPSLLLKKAHERQFVELKSLLHGQSPFLSFSTESIETPAYVAEEDVPNSLKSGSFEEQLFIDRFGLANPSSSKEPLEPPTTIPSYTGLFEPTNQLQRKEGVFRLDDSGTPIQTKKAIVESPQVSTFRPHEEPIKQKENEVHKDLSYPPVWETDSNNSILPPHQSTPTVLPSPSIWTNPLQTPIPIVPLQKETKPSTWPLGNEKNFPSSSPSPLREVQEPLKVERVQEIERQKGKKDEVIEKPRPQQIQDNDWTKAKKEKAAFSLKDIQQEELKQKKQQMPVQKEEPIVTQPPQWMSWGASSKAKPSFKDIQAQELKGKTDFPPLETSKPSHVSSETTPEPQKPSKVEPKVEPKVQQQQNIPTKGTQNASKKAQNASKASTQQQPPPAKSAVWGSGGSSKPKTLKDIQAEEQKVPGKVTLEQQQPPPPSSQQRMVVEEDIREERKNIKQISQERKEEFPSLSSKKDKKVTNKPPSSSPSSSSPQVVVPQTIEKPETNTVVNKKTKKKGSKVDPSLLGFTSPTRETEIVGQSDV